MSMFPDKNPTVAASGLKWPGWESDCNMIVQFMGKKDVSEQMGSKEPAVYLIFFDGINTFNVSQNYKLQQQEFNITDWYYIHNAGEVPMGGGHADMQDIEITPLGKTGEEVNIDPKIVSSGKLQLLPSIVGPINYTKMNHVLRDTKHDTFNPPKGKKADKKD